MCVCVCVCVLLYHIMNVWVCVCVCVYVCVCGGGGVQRCFYWYLAFSPGNSIGISSLPEAFHALTEVYIDATESYYTYWRVSGVFVYSTNTYHT